MENQKYMVKKAAKHSENEKMIDLHKEFKPTNKAVAFDAYREGWKGVLSGLHWSDRGTEG